jgi:hypothetical protein
VLSVDRQVGVKWKLVSCKERSSWKSATIQKGLESGSRGLAIVRSRYQATASKDIAGWKRLNVCSSDLRSVEISDGAIIKYSYEIYVWICR